MDPRLLSDIRQRWRLFVSAAANVGAVSQRDVTASWEEALATSGLPLATTDGPPPRPRFWLGPPLPSGMAGEREPLDIALAERLRIHLVREALEPRIPGGGRLVDLYDVWPGAPTLAASVVAADYRVTLASPTGSLPSGPQFDAIVAALLGSDRILVMREKGGRSLQVDIRPTLLALASVALAPDAAASVEAVTVVRMRLRVGSAGPVGRPADIVTAIGDRAGLELRVAEAVRERVVTDDAEQSSGEPRSSGGPPVPPVH